MNLMESLLANKLAAKQSSGGSDLTPEVKEALLDCFANVAWATEDGQQYYDALEDALYGLQSISAVYTQSGTVYDTDSLDSLKADLVVTALYGDGSTQTVPEESYTLSGTLTDGTSTITVSYAGKTTTFDATVTTWTLTWSYADGGYPYDVDSQNWTKLAQTNGISFVSGKGVRYHASTSNFQVTPTNYTSAPKCTLEAVVQFDTFSDKGAVFLRCGDGTNGMQALVGRDGKISMDNAATFLPGVLLETGREYTLRIDFDNSGDCDTYLDGVKISTVSASAIGSKTIQAMMSGQSGTTGDFYLRIIRIKIH